MASTPTTEVAVVGMKACGGIILTASHNPKQWNALKLLNERGGIPLMMPKEKKCFVLQMPKILALQL